MPPVLSKADTTKEQNNFIRAFMLIFEVGTKCLRKEFDRELHPKQLKGVLNANRNKLYNALNSTQKQQLYPRRGHSVVTSTDLDITLMLLLLKHLAGRNIGDMFPSEWDESKDADLTRLKWYRNQICHLPACRITHETFLSWSKGLRQVLKRLDPELEEEAKQRIEDDLSTFENDVRFYMCQLGTILHTFGCNIFRKLTKMFWYLPALDQMCHMLSLLELHFWNFPPHHLIWNEFQDSYQRESDIMFFERTGSFSEDIQDANCDSSSTNVSGITQSTDGHVIQIECKKCPYVIKEDRKLIKQLVPNDIIEMICTCENSSMTARICFATLCSYILTGHYRHRKIINASKQSTMDATKTQATEGESFVCFEPHIYNFFELESTFNEESFLLTNSSTTNPSYIPCGSFSGIGVCNTICCNQHLLK